MIERYTERHRCNQTFLWNFKGLLKAIKIIQTFEGKQNHSNDEKNSNGRKQLQWKPPKVITDNVIIWLMWSDWLNED